MIFFRFITVALFCVSAIEASGLESVLNALQRSRKIDALSQSLPSTIRLSPDGNRAAYLVENFDRVALMVKRFGESAEIITSFNTNIDQLAWLNNDQIVLRAVTREGRYLFRISTDNITKEILTPKEGVAASIEKVINDARSTPKLYFTIQDEPFGDTSLYSLNLETHEVALNGGRDLGFFSWLIAPDGLVFGGLRDNEDGSIDIMRLVNLGNENRATKLTRLPIRYGEHYSIDIEKPSASGISLFSYFHTESMSLRYYDEHTSDFSRKSFEPKNGDVIEYFRHPITRKVVTYRTTDSPKQNQGSSWRYRRILSVLKRVLGETSVHRIHDMDRSGNRAIVESFGDQSPPMFTIVDLHTGHFDILFDQSSFVDTGSLCPVEEIIVPSKGINLPCLLIKQKGRSQARGTVVVAYGGPFIGQHWGWRPLEQLIASEGFNVLVVNYRGATGFGRSFYERGIGEAGAGMIEDVKAALLFAHASPGIVVGLGFSYGGYAMLSATTGDTTIADGICLVGPLLDPTTRFAQISSLNQRYADLQYRLWFGDATAVNLVDAAAPRKHPLLLLQGNSDEVASAEIASRFVSKQRAVGGDVAYVTFSDGHEVGTDSLRKIYRQVCDFLDKAEKRGNSALGKH